MDYYYGVIAGGSTVSGQRAAWGAMASFMGEKFERVLSYWSISWKRWSPLEAESIGREKGVHLGTGKFGRPQVHCSRQMASFT